MTSRTISQKIIEIVDDEPDDFETRELNVKDLLRPVTRETDKKKADLEKR
jgi:hypothetical protein